jgi:hypothetical protein
MATLLPLLGSCTSAHHVGGPTPRVNSSPSLAEATPEPSAAAAAAGTFVRSCATAVSGSLGAFSTWSKSSRVVGGFALVWIRQAAQVAPSRFRTPQAVKILALVKSNEQVVLSVPRSERRHVSLIYDPNAFVGTYRVRDGEDSVRFQPCPGPGSWEGATQFNGGVIVAGARCVTLLVTPDSGESTPMRSAFGKGACALR